MSRPSEFYREPLPEYHEPAESPISGNLRPLPLVGDAFTGGYDVKQSVELLNAPRLAWREWHITLNALWPERQTINWPNNAVSGVPVVSGVPRCQLRWGAGGFLRYAEFDYPYLGGAFAVHANNVQLSARATVASTGLLQGEAAQVGAWLTPGVMQPDCAPMQFFAGVDIGQTSIPPYARYALIGVYNGAAGGAVIPAAEFGVDFLELQTSRNVGRFRAHVGSAGDGQEWLRLPIPNGATAISINTNPLGMHWTLSWEMSFA